MTTLIAWVAVDSRRPSSAYIASDSRISWDDGSTWDHGKKTFASAQLPDIAGFSGDVLLSTMILSQYFALLDSGAIEEQSHEPSQRIDLLYGYLRRASETMPNMFHKDFSIIYMSRESESMDSIFKTHIFKFKKSAECKWERQEIPPPEESSLLVIQGSGKESYWKASRPWEQSEHKGTSRSVYSAFVDSIKSNADPKSGGPPQLVGLYRKDPGRLFGTIHDGERFLNGLQIHDEIPDGSRVEWRNEVFERVSGNTKSRLLEAQTHKKPQVD